MTIEEAIAVYNQVATRYNEVMALYDLCDCASQPPNYNYKKRAPLYNPLATEKYKDLLDIQKTYSGGNVYYYVKLVQLIEELSEKLEEISLKKHGPLDKYSPNGYIQLYTEALFDSVTDEEVTDPHMVSYLLPYGVVDHPNGTAIDYKDNYCEDLDRLDPPPDSSEFLETKVYPIVDTCNPDNVDTTVANAVSVFNSVADLPKQGDLHSDTYCISVELSYEYQYWVSDPQPDNPDYGYFEWHKKSKYTEKLKEIYPKVIACMKDDYNNWLNGLPSTIQADFTSLMNDYTVLSTQSAYVYEEKLIIRKSDSYTVYGPGRNGNVPGAPIIHPFFPNSTTYGYMKPTIEYTMVYWESGIPPTNPIDVTADNACTGAHLGPIAFNAIRFENRYSNSDAYYEGFYYNWECGEIQWYSAMEHEYTDLGTELCYTVAETYTDLKHLTSITNHNFKIKIDPCTTYILGGDGINSVETFPTISFDYYSSLYYPDGQYYASCHVYNGTPYIPYVLNMVYEFHGVDIKATTYIEAHAAESGVSEEPAE